MSVRACWTRVDRNIGKSTLVLTSFLLSIVVIGCWRGNAAQIPQEPRVAYKNTLAQESTSAMSAETPEHFIRRVLQIATSGRGTEILDMSEDIYSSGLLDAMFGEGCFPTHKPCIVDHLMWAKVCGCRYFPEDIEKKGDPLCGCPAKLKFWRLSVARTSVNSADASALLNLEPNMKDKVDWHLVMTPKGWRIDDVATPDIPSLKTRISR